MADKQSRLAEIYKAEKRKDNYSKMTHEHNFVKDLDGQVACSICGFKI
jgi:hypothetical protein